MKPKLGRPRVAHYASRLDKYDIHDSYNFSHSNDNAPYSTQTIGQSDFLRMFSYVVRCWLVVTRQKSGVDKVHRGKVYQVSFLAAWYSRSTTAFMADTVSITSSKVLSLKEIYSNHMKITWRNVRLQSFRL